MIILLEVLPRVRARWCGCRLLVPRLLPPALLQHPHTCKLTTPTSERRLSDAMYALHAPLMYALHAPLMYALHAPLRRSSAQVAPSAAASRRQARRIPCTNSGTGGWHAPPPLARGRRLLPQPLPTEGRRGCRGRRGLACCRCWGMVAGGRRGVAGARRRRRRRQQLPARPGQPCHRGWVEGGGSCLGLDRPPLRLACRVWRGTAGAQAGGRVGAWRAAGDSSGCWGCSS